MENHAHCILCGKIIHISFIEQCQSEYGLAHEECVENVRTKEKYIDTIYESMEDDICSW